MIDSVSAYRSHDFVRKSIDLLAAGAAWRGGRFTSSTGSIPQPIADAIDEARLAEIARQMLLLGRGLVKVVSPDGSSPVLQFPETQDSAPDPTTVEIQRVESSFEPAGLPILQSVLPSFGLYEKALEHALGNPAAAELLRYALPPIHSALAIPAAMLDQGRISQTPPEVLMAGAIQFKSEVALLRHNLRFGLDRVGDALGQAMGILDVEWDWNHEWLPSGMCKYGHVYQVFRSQGLTLEPIRASELGGIQLAVNSGLISRATLRDCEVSYGT